MDAMRELFTTSIGWLSMFTIGFVIVMGAYIGNFVKKQIAKDAAAAAQGKR